MRVFELNFHQSESHSLLSAPESVFEHDDKPCIAIKPECEILDANNLFVNVFLRSIKMIVSFLLYFLQLSLVFVLMVIA